MKFLQEHGSPFQFLTGYTVQGYNLSVGNKTERVKGQPVSIDYFHVLGINPLLGRDFLAEENSGNGAHVAILSYGIWQTQMGGDRKTVGRTITLDGEPFTVIGVMPPGLEASADPILPGETDVGFGDGRNNPFCFEPQFARRSTSGDRSRSEPVPDGKFAIIM